MPQNSVLPGYRTLKFRNHFVRTKNAPLLLAGYIQMKLRQYVRVSWKLGRTLIVLLFNRLGPNHFSPNDLILQVTHKLFEPKYNTCKFSIPPPPDILLYTLTSLLNDSCGM